MTLIKAFGEDWKFGQFKKQIADMNIYADAEGKFGPRPQEQNELEQSIMGGVMLP